MRTLDATKDDLPAILEIYNDAVRNTTAIWNEVEVDVSDRRAWMRDRQAKGFPVLVAKDADGAVLGYASYGDWRSWDGYRHTVEHSVYVQADARGQGIGRDLLAALIVRAKKAGKHVMVAGIEASNAPSIQLHESLGFHEAGRLSEVGTKFGTWLDLIFLQLLLDQRPKP
jgi:phosphinothricin acetyltransferase